MTTPTVGRIVHYYACDQMMAPFRPSAAIVTSVWPDAGLVALAVFEYNGVQFFERVDFSEKPERGCWSWPPRAALAEEGT